MKVVVAHPGTQHVKHLLKVLLNAGLLQRFYTVLESDKITRFFYNLAPDAIKKKLRNYHFNLPPHLVRHYPYLFLFYRVWPTHWMVTQADKIFSKQVVSGLKRVKYDSVISYENSNLEIFKFAKKQGKTTILDLAQIHHEEIIKALADNMDALTLEREKRYVNAYKEDALKYTDYILTLSSFAAQSLLKHGIKKERVFEVNLGVNLKLFQLKTQYQNGSLPLRFLFVGTIMRRKGIQLLLQVWHELNLSDAELVLIGPLADAKDLISQLPPKTQHFPFLPHEELVKQYQAADVFVFPSYLDSWAQTVIEAMACGTPVIVTENTGAKDAVRKGGGFIIPVNDAEALKEKILHFYHNRNEIERLGREANFVAQQYTWENYQHQVLEALNEIACRENLQY